LGARFANDGSRSKETGGGSRDVLIGSIRFLLESIQLRVVEKLPPLSAERSVARLSGLPADLGAVSTEFLIGGWNGDGWARVFRADDAGTQEQRAGERNGEGQPGSGSTRARQRLGFATG
jgi:hypothetical protein